MPHPKLPQQISNPVSENIQKLAALFPSAVKDGELDIEALKQELGEFTEVGPEKYELTWAGKQKAKQTAFEPVMGRTLKYIPEESKNPDTTENLYIEGDNLEVLKLLRQNYYGAVKMIYIDPPYNTGNDFIYNDNFRMSKEEHEIEEGDRSELGERYTVNRKDQNRYHTNWLNMMYPRLKVARDLLKDNGVIFISIDDNENTKLKTICEEIFGAHNFIATIVWQKVFSPKNTAAYFSEDHEYILVFAKDKNLWKPELLPRSQESIARYSNPDNDPRGPWMSGAIQARNFYSKGQYEVISPNGSKFSNPKGTYWRFSKEKFKEFDRENRIWWGEKGGNVPRIKRFLSEVKQGVVPQTLWKYQDVGHTQEAKEEFLKYVDFEKTENILNTIKPTKLLKQILNIGTRKDQNDIVLDFFSGSASLAHSVMNKNYEDNGNRKYILIQISEALPKEEIDIRTIFDIGKSRISNAGKKILEENQDKEGIENLDIGFKVFRVGDTNINWLHQDLKGADMFDHYDQNASDKDKLDFTPGFTDLDVVYEIMLRQTDIPLSSSVENLPDIGERTFIFADSFVVCLEQAITRELVDKLAAIEPLPIKFIFRDSAFDDDISLKDETFRRLSALIERNSGGEKQTYTVEFI